MVDWSRPVVGLCQIVEALVVAAVIVVIDKGLDLGVEVAWQAVVLEQDSVLEGLMTPNGHCECRVQYLQASGAEPDRGRAGKGLSRMSLGMPTLKVSVAPYPVPRISTVATAIAPL
jgi:hypothetical protein